MIQSKRANLPAHPAGSGTPGRVVFSEEQLAARVNELAGDISTAYQGLNPILVGLLTGTFVFLADLLRELSIPVALDFMALNRYQPQTADQPAATILRDLGIDIEGRHVLIVDDFVDTGLTLHYLCGVLLPRWPESLQICTLLDRPARRLVELPIRFVGFEAPDDFLVGYGLHYRHEHRQLPYIAALEQAL